MKPFKLQVVLEHRQRLVDQARQHLAKALQEEKKLVEAVTACRQQLDQVVQDYEQRQQQGMLAHEFMLYENQLNHQRERLERLEEQVVMARQHTLSCRKGLEEAGREKKLLEKVKEKQQQAEMKEQQRREMAEIDEIAILFRDEDES
ncbi:flagellar export protein FliJ [Desulfuromonas acetoxidans]|uniref:Flagellar FliJ protein n=1 Tax=Desulfuromonas acetoxidans (strain DSM 684 / 11070) TaxID=281689 RepID=Q1JZT5_DESA6|nr:flagellar export protein FliJ [Desulfuromonas acetoxidans]EAT15807.1 Flagellar export FliJ [Desulfuromonas acetoxidans DSM 684]MBF0644991.1 flagellar export protein FliJ [Desulfuromonas acetoxidans]NVD25647.1 flagellar export protein FliJ [Desulfuromonas acetoxidans]NVE17700.1 flagellar export protein FliJ [Desulfuromonas acetoxidans]